MLVTVKRSALLRCLVLLLSIALASGNAHAALHIDVAHAGGPCPEEHGAHLVTHREAVDEGFGFACDIFFQVQPGARDVARQCFGR